MIVDLHSHTTASDGTLSPDQLVQRAVDHQVEMLAITDHDTLAAYENISPELKTRIKIIRGIELSTSWRGASIHVVGLNVEIKNSTLQNGIRLQQAARQQRAEQIITKLNKLGADINLETVKQIGGTNIGRPHIAQALVNGGFVANREKAFSKYLGAGKTGDIKQCWADLETVVSWINGAGGVAALAHPLKYKFTRRKLGLLVDAFVEAGGQGIEVVCGRQAEDKTRMLAELCADKQLKASAGSDFHSPGAPWSELGAYTKLPRKCEPVWNLF